MSGSTHIQGKDSNGDGGKFADVTNGRLHVTTDGSAGVAPYTVAFGEVAGNAAATVFPTITAKWVRFKALYNNAGRAYIGKSGVTKQDGSTDTTTGWELSAGDETPWLPCLNLNEFYRICDNAGDDVVYIVLG